MVLGRGAGLSDEQMASFLLDPLPEGMFAPDEEALIIFARKSALMQPIDDDTYERLRAHFTVEQSMELCFVVGLHQMVTRMHSLFLTDVDEDTLESFGATCQVRLPTPPKPTS